MFFHKPVYAKCYVRLSLSPIFDRLTDEEKPYKRFMQDNAKAHTTNSFMDA
jgi:hypothetical protein